MHTEIIQKVIDKLGYTSYLEIGLDRGINWCGITCKKKVGVDPVIMIPKLEYGDFFCWGNETIYRKTSDDFFASCGHPVADIVFIDGMHTFEQSAKDFHAASRRIAEGGLVLMHDTNPTSEIESMIYDTYMTEHPEYQGAWVGDVWKTIYALSQSGNVNYFTLDIPYGLTFLWLDKSKEIKPVYEDVAKLPYSFFNKNRKDILNLKPVTYLGEFLLARTTC